MCFLKKDVLSSTSCRIVQLFKKLLRDGAGAAV